MHGREKGLLQQADSSYPKTGSVSLTRKAGLQPAQQQPKPLPVPPWTVSKNMLEAVGSNFNGATTHWEYLHETSYSCTAAFHGHMWCPGLNRGQTKLSWFFTNALLGTNSSGRVFSLSLSRPVSQTELWYLLKRKRKKKRHVQACPTHIGHITTHLLPNCFSKGCMPQATPWARNRSSGKAKNYSTAQETAANRPAAKEKVPGLTTEESQQQKCQWEGGKSMIRGSISMKRNVIYWTKSCIILPAALLRCFLPHRRGGRRERVPSVPAHCLYTGSFDQINLQCFTWAEKCYGSWI